MVRLLLQVVVEDWLCDLCSQEGMWIEPWTVNFFLFIISLRKKERETVPWYPHLLREAESSGKLTRKDGEGKMAIKAFEGCLCWCWWGHNHQTLHRLKTGKWRKFCILLFRTKNSSWSSGDLYFVRDFPGLESPWSTPGGSSGSRKKILPAACQEILHQCDIPEISCYQCDISGQCTAGQEWELPRKSVAWLEVNDAEIPRKVMSEDSSQRKPSWGWTWMQVNSRQCPWWS